MSSLLFTFLNPRLWSLAMLPITFNFGQMVVSYVFLFFRGIFFNFENASRYSGLSKNIYIGAVNYLSKIFVLSPVSVNVLKNFEADGLVKLKILFENIKLVFGYIFFYVIFLSNLVLDHYSVNAILASIFNFWIDHDNRIFWKYSVNLIFWMKHWNQSIMLQNLPLH